MATKIGLTSVKAKAEIFTNCNDLSQLEKLLRLKANQLTLLAMNPLYYHFSVKKPNGGQRAIEAPEAILKKVQRKLNEYLQYIYYLNQSKAAYGYILSVRNSKINKNIVTNAAQHLNCSYLLNVDFSKFFHQIKQEDVYAIFKSSLFRFNNNTAAKLTKICCYKGRLPMGAPTSPVLSNLYTIQLDNELLNWATKENFIYTRFVDDLSFSSKNQPITSFHKKTIEFICEKHNLYINNDKTKYYKLEDIKVVTGLVVSDKINIQPQFYIDLNKDIKRLRALVEVRQITGNLSITSAIKEYKKEVWGKINFIKMVLGLQNEKYHFYLDEFEKASYINEELLSMSWTKFNPYT